MSEPTPYVRPWVMEHAPTYGTTPATLYTLLMLALEPWWADMTPGGRVVMVGAWFDVDRGSELTRLLNVQQIALGDYQSDKRRASHG